MRKYLTIILPWGNYIYKKINMSEYLGGCIAAKTEHLIPKHAIRTRLY